MTWRRWLRRRLQRLREIAPDNRWYRSFLSLVPRWMGHGTIGGSRPKEGRDHP
jgi:hypothetical protein